MWENSKTHWLWLDLEMTGLDPETCHIIEVAAILTGLDMKPVFRFQEVVYQPPEVLAGMDEWNQTHHGASGLLDRIPHGKPLPEVQGMLIRACQDYRGEDGLILAGNSIHQDRRFIDRYMPGLSAMLHYRMLDVTAFKLVFESRFGLKFQKSNAHRALEDIEASMAELEFYLSHIYPGREPSGEQG